MTSGPHEETPPAPDTLPAGVLAASVALSLVLLVAPLRDRLILVAAVLLIGALAAVLIPIWFRPRA
jgi:hypothetical protein